MIAEDDLFCSECRHEIPFGALCLSQVPVEMPMGFHRRSYESFCVDCVTCRIKGREEPCFARWLARPYAQRKVAGDRVRCGYCSGAIPEGTRTVAQKVYILGGRQMAVPMRRAPTKPDHTKADHTQADQPPRQPLPCPGASHGRA